MGMFGQFSSVNTKAARTTAANDASWEAKTKVLFRQSALQQLAYTTIRAALINAAGDSIPLDVYTFIDKLLEALCVAGFAIWKNSPGTAPTVLEADKLTLLRKERGGWEVADYAGAKQRGYSFVIADEPIVPSTFTNIIRAWHWRSPCAKSIRSTLRYEMIEEQWLQRDRINSRASCFTAVDPNIQYKGQDTVPFFVPVDTARGQAQHAQQAPIQPRNSAQNQSKGGQAYQTQTRTSQEHTIASMVSGRAIALDRLKNMSGVQRENAVGPQTAHRDLLSACVAETKVNPGHTEHIITDGRSYHQVSHLPSTVDAREQYARARHTVLYTFGVPPQATGESVNSERSASNHRQYEISINVFDVTVQRYTRVINAALALIDGTPRLSPPLPSQTVREIGPLLNIEAHIDAISATFGINRADIDPSQVKAFLRGAEVAEQHKRVTSRAGDNTTARENEE